GQEPASRRGQRWRSLETKRRRESQGAMRMEVAEERPSASPPAIEHTGQAQVLRLYIAGQTPRSIAAFANLKRICEEPLAGRYRIQLLDLVQDPHLTAGDPTPAVPPPVRTPPEHP